MKEVINYIFYNLNIGANQISLLKEFSLENTDLELYTKCADLGLRYRIFKKEVLTELLNISSLNNNCDSKLINKKAEGIIEDFNNLSANTTEISKIFCLSLKNIINLLDNILFKSRRLSKPDLDNIRKQVVNFDLEQMV